MSSSSAGVSPTAVAPKSTTISQSLSREGMPAQKSGQQPPVLEVIYGEDDRLDMHAVKDPILRKVAPSTLTLTRPNSVNINGDVATLNTRPYGVSPNERFSDQKTLGFCSGSLVGDDLVMTAGHCISKGDESRVAFVFDFAINSEGGNTPDQVPASSVYKPAEVIHSVVDRGTGADWALVRLDRAVTDRAPLTVDRGDGATKGDPVTVIGHPWGLARKVAGGANVRNDSPVGYYVANLDTYGGNSGSAVFNPNNGEINGILVRGENDWTRDPTGRISNRCPDDGCRGEDVTKISMVLDALDKANKTPAPPQSYDLDKVRRALYSQAWATVQVANYDHGPDENPISDREFLRPVEIAALPAAFQRVAKTLKPDAQGLIRSRSLSQAVTREVRKALDGVVDNGKTVFDKREDLEKVVGRIGDPDAQKMALMAIQDVYGN